MTAYLESKDRIKKIAEDIIEHYTEEVLPNGLKAQVVATSIVAACRYKYELEEAIKVRIEKELSKPACERDEELLKQMPFMKVCAVVSMSDNNELGYITRARRDAAEMDAIESFKKDFNYDKPESGVAILCVCDRLLTGFDAPVEQVMYLDKNLREHDLMQAIARVNRTKVMKCGYVKGRNYYLQYHGEAKEIEFKGRNFYAPEGLKEKLNGLFKEFYRKRGYKFITPRVHKYADMMGLTIEEIAVLELKSRWASCPDKKRKVNFHRKVMMAPASVIDYLIVHELCHFKHKRHNAEFWNEVDKYYPEYQKQVAWLKIYGAALEV